MIMKLSILTLFLIISSGVFSQSISYQVISASGNTCANAQADLCWTLGEAIIYTYSVPGYDVSQGFQQGMKEVSTKIKDTRQELGITAYPNPVTDVLHLDYRNSSTDRTTISISTANGVVLREISKTGTIDEIDFSEIPPGIYFVKIGIHNQYKTFTIIKSPSNEKN
jgi:hypothetical protein